MENPRRMLVKLRLGALGEKWTQQAAYEETLSRLRSISNPLDIREGLFLRDTLLEILEQTEPSTYDFRLLPQLFEPRQKQRGQEITNEYVNWARNCWNELIKVEPFVVEFEEFWVQPCVLNEDGFTEDLTYDHLVRGDKIDAITTIPKQDRETIRNWRQQLYDAHSNTGVFFDPPNKTQVTILSLKEFSWRFGYFDINQKDARHGEPLRNFILNFLQKQAEEHGGIKKTVLMPKDFAPVRGILGKFTLPGYRVSLKPEYRQKLLKQLNPEEEPTESTESKEPPKKKFWKL
jgi:hypothetical protein